METEFKRYNKYEIMKLQDIKLYLSPIQRHNLMEIIETIQLGRKAVGKRPCNNYVVVNEDQPYAEQVWALIKEQWEKDNDRPRILDKTS